MMKLAVVVLFGLIGVAIALHGTGGYGNGGGYGNNGGGYGGGYGDGGHRHHKSSESSSSSESEEFIPPPKPKVCKTTCIDNALADFNIPGVTPLDCTAMTNTVDIVACCQNWGLLHGRTLIEISGAISGAKKVCCERICS
uniref:Hydrophobin n=1 Tax=Panagrolaimus sp. PS1159 TaxID=55785 RepID=A0AC35GR13_9BILA